MYVDVYTHLLPPRVYHAAAAAMPPARARCRAMIDAAALATPADIAQKHDKPR